ncbi:hypothetical protein L083_6507 [Actinoplanes sp. N902-109]|nr:hypothetical protein L083_6507 [Actinoplanes sp. N902-109]
MQPAQSGGPGPNLRASGCEPARSGVQNGSGPNPLTCMSGA